MYASLAFSEVKEGGGGKSRDCVRKSRIILDHIKQIVSLESDHVPEVRSQYFGIIGYLNSS